MIISKNCVGLIAGFAMLFFAKTAEATTIFSDFGPANAYDPNEAHTVSGSTSFPGFVRSAMAFTPSGNYTLTQIDVAILLGNGTNSALLTLNSDSGGLPGAILASWTLSGLPFEPGCCTVQTVTPSGSVVLSSGTIYWLVASAIASDTFAGWNFNNTGATGLSAYDLGTGFGSQDGPLSAFDVLGNVFAVVPEPTTLALTAGGFAFLLSLRRRKQ